MTALCCRKSTATCPATQRGLRRSETDKVWRVGLGCSRSSNAIVYYALCWTNVGRLLNVIWQRVCRFRWVGCVGGGAVGQQDILDACPTLRKICPSKSHRPTVGHNLTFLLTYPLDHHTSSRPTVHIHQQNRCLNWWVKAMRSLRTCPSSPSSANTFIDSCRLGRDMRTFLPPLHVSTAPVPDLNSVKSHNPSCPAPQVIPG